MPCSSYCLIQCLKDRLCRSKAAENGTPYPAVGGGGGFGMPPAFSTHSHSNRLYIQFCRFKTTQLSDFLNRPGSKQQKSEHRVSQTGRFLLQVKVVRDLLCWFHSAGTDVTRQMPSSPPFNQKWKYPVSETSWLFFETLGVGSEAFYDIPSSESFMFKLPLYAVPFLQNGRGSPIPAMPVIIIIFVMIQLVKGWSAGCKARFRFAQRRSLSAGVEMWQKEELAWNFNLKVCGRHRSAKRLQM